MYTFTFDFAAFDAFPVVMIFGSIDLSGSRPVGAKVDLSGSVLLN